MAKSKTDFTKIGKTVAPTADNPYIRPKHRAIFERMKGGEKISGALIALSYKPSVANKPSLITNTKSWQALMDEQLPEDLLAERHRELLNKRSYRMEVTGKGKNRTAERVDDGPEAQTVLKALELGYKLRKRVGDDSVPPAQASNVYNLYYQPHVQANVRAFEEALKKQIAYETDGQGAIGDGATTSHNDAGRVDAGPTAQDSHA